ncbi:MAG: thioredoxin family protein [Bacteroidetes bacterium]|nr:thioredoxin family protein [Bacteroidota bacterium]
MITQKLLDSALSWNEFYALSEQLVAEHRTTGSNQSETLLKYTELNWVRMHRIAKTLSILPEIREKIESLTESYIALVITEAWCGDGAQNLPAIAKICDLSDKLALKVIFRDENLDIMNSYLTNGAMSIPIIVLLRKVTLEEVGVWGPKPKAAMEILANFKANPTMSRDVFYKELHTWYAKNKSVDVQYEFMQLLNDAELSLKV